MGQAPSKPRDSAADEAVYVRVGKLRDVMLMRGRGQSPPTSPGAGCVACTARGTEWGVPLRPISIRDHRISEGTVLREASEADRRRVEELEELEQGGDFRFCLAKIEELGLPMKLRAVERLLGGERIIFYFTADGRVDFRDLVKHLAREFRTRIELRQIGARDEARLTGDVGVCGQALCCRSFLGKLQPVSLQMAKNQGRAPQGDKNLGVCGRLKCCLRFENEVYTELRSGLPRHGARLQTTFGEATVTSVDILRREVRMRGADGTEFLQHADDLLPGGIPRRPEG